jgi:hypothetical protein
MRILVTGSRNWTDISSITEALNRQWYEANAKGERMTVVHGAYVTGADRIARDWALTYRSPSVQEEPHQARWRTQGSAAGPIRNQEMVDAGADICLAFPLGESRGTRDCMRRAVKAGIPVINYGDTAS